MHIVPLSEGGSSVAPFGAVGRYMGHILGANSALLFLTLVQQFLAIALSKSGQQNSMKMNMATATRKPKPNEAPLTV